MTDKNIKNNDNKTELENTKEKASNNKENDLEENRQKIEGLNNRLLRALADSENLRKIHEKEKEDILKFGSSSFALQILNLTDNLHRAFNLFKNNEKFKSPEFKEILSGIEIIEKDLESTLKQNHIIYINCMGTKFDPNFHQAIGEKESEQEEGTIIEEIQKGYNLHERLLRPSLVYVAKKPKK